MFPVLFSLGPIVLYTFNLLLVCAFLGGGFVYWKRAHEEHYEDDEVFDVGVLAALCGLLISRIGFILFHFPDFQLNVLAWISILERPGLQEVFGIVGTLWCIGWLAKRKKWDHYELMEFGAMGATVFLVFMWIARFFAGSQIGTPTQMPWGISFPNTFDARHPLQLYMVAGFTFVYFLLRKIEKKYRFYQWYRGSKQTAQSGFVVGLFLICYGLLNSIFTPFRLTDVKVGFVSIDLIVYVLVFLAGFVVIYLRSGHSKVTKRLPKRKTSPQNRVQVSSLQRIFRRR